MYRKMFFKKIYKFKYSITLILIFTTSHLTILNADKIFLEDGEVLHGRFLGKYNNRYKFKTTEGKVRYIPEDKVYDLKMGETPNFENERTRPNIENSENIPERGTKEERVNRAEADPFPNPNKTPKQSSDEPEAPKKSKNAFKNGFYSNWYLGVGQLTIADQTYLDKAGNTIPNNTYKSYAYYTSFSMGWSFNFITPYVGAGYLYKLIGSTTSSDGTTNSILFNDYMYILGLNFLTPSNFNVNISARQIFGGKYEGASANLDQGIANIATSKITSGGYYGYGLEIGKYWVINNHYNIGISIQYFSDNIQLSSNDFADTPRKANVQFLGFGMNMIFH